MGVHPKAFFHIFAGMKKLWNIIFLLLFCNITSLLVLANGENEYSIQQNDCCISQQQTLPSLDTTPDFTILQQPESVATIANRTNSVESNVTVKTASSNNNKFSHSDLRKYINSSRIALVIYNNSTIVFSRAIDHYVYAFRHIII